MTSNVSQNQDQAELSNKEINFRKQEEAMKASYERKLEQERAERLQLQKKTEELERMIQDRARSTHDQDDDDDDEPYVDKKKLEKKLNQFGQKNKQETASVVQHEVQKALAEERRNQWLKNNPDFYEVMNHAQKFAEKDPELAETILEMPEGFERQKLVYKNIKALGLHKKEEDKPSIQDTINRNRTNPYYQPSGVGTPPYGMVTGGKDYSPGDQKNAYDKMKDLQRRLRIG